MFVATFLLSSDKFQDAPGSLVWERRERSCDDRHSQACVMPDPTFMGACNTGIIAEALLCYAVASSHGG